MSRYRRGAARGGRGAGLSGASKGTISLAFPDHPAGAVDSRTVDVPFDEVDTGYRRGGADGGGEKSDEDDQAPCLARPHLLRPGHLAPGGQRPVAHARSAHLAPSIAAETIPPA